ncbi:MAG: hypothetical protein JOZ96_13155 [Acidobacteria bacterium]|nr:hypothetical protein [Acidobacteriota bacterium]
MILFVVAWIPLLLACWLCGAAVLELTAGAEVFERAGDRAALSAWVGLVVLAQALLAVSLFAPLTPQCGAGVAAALCVPALLSRRVRAEAARLRRMLSLRLALGLLALTAGVAAFASQPVTYYDTGLYHFQNIKWLAEHGAVRGLALVQVRFAFASSWLALAAPFEAGPFGTRASAVSCGFALLVATLHALVCARRCAAGSGRGSDWLLLLSYAFVLPPALVWRQPASASPNLPVFFLAAAVVWAVSLLEERRDAADARLLPVLLAAGAVGVKLIGLPLLVITSAYYLRGAWLSPRLLLKAGAAVALMLLPTAAYGLVTAGCPFFPAKALCVETPWSVGAGEAERLANVIRDWARWDGRTPPWGDGWNWVTPWLTKGLTQKNWGLIPLCLLVACAGAFVRAKPRLRALGTSVMLAGCAGLLVFLLLRGGELLMVSMAVAAVVAALTQRGGEFAGRGWALAVGLAGSALTLYAAPALTFGLGYTAVLFGALFVPAASGLDREEGAGLGERLWRRRASPAALLLACGLFFFATTAALETFTRVGAGVEGRFRRMLLPPPLPAVATAAREENGLRYFVPVGGPQCWGAELPCAELELRGGVRLCDAGRGLRGGFVRAEAAPDR